MIRDMVGVMEIYGEVVDGSHGLAFVKSFFMDRIALFFFRS